MAVHSATSCRNHHHEFSAWVISPGNTGVCARCALVMTVGLSGISLVVNDDDGKAVRCGNFTWEDLEELTHEVPPLEVSSES
jgi:hypothetical protein